MPARQLHLFAPPKPLVQRLGEAFFRAAPREPGVYGAFKSHVTAGYGALLRLTWAAWHQPASPHDFPAQLLSSKPPRQYRFKWNSRPAPWSQESFLGCLQGFLAGKSDSLVQLLSETVPARDDLSSFQRALQARDLEILNQFYQHGPRRNHGLSQRHNLSNPLILQEELEDLLVENS